MDFLKVKIKFRKAPKANPKEDSEETPHPNGDSTEIEAEPRPEIEAEAENENENNDEDEDDDDDFITNEVKRRLKELRRNSFMVLIPEEEEENGDDVAEEDDVVAVEDDVAGSREWREVEAEARQWWGGFDALYEKYCERMLFFDRMSSQQLNEPSGCETPTTPSPRSATKKLRSPLSCLSLKVEEPNDETEHLQKPQSEPYQDIETAYSAQLSLTWEALHCQYTQLANKIFCRPETPTCYNHSAQLLQQFQVLLQRYIENEPFEMGLRPEIYARARKIWPKLLQVPNIKASDHKEAEGEESSLIVLAPDLMKIMESSIVTFHRFLKMDKKKSSALRNRSGNENAARVHQIQSSLEKKLVKLKELRKKSRGWKKMSWPSIFEDVQVLFSIIDVEIVSCVVRMTGITNEQLIWCEEKTKKLDLTDGKLRRDPSPLLFPC